ncbi:MAG: hypothetical protein ABI860_07865 [Gemmatimonadales bacterium]
MPTPRIIGAAPGETPAELKTPSGRSRRLPEDLLRQATKRLQILALMACLAKDAANRPPSAADLGAGLAALNSAGARSD